MEGLNGLFFFIVVEGVLPEESLICQQGYYVQGGSMGIAIEKVLSDALSRQDEDIEDVAPVYVSIVTEDEVEGDIYETIYENVFMVDELYIQEASRGRTFQTPHGIILSGWQPEGFHRDDLVEGFAVASHDEEFILEAVLPKHRPLSELSRLVEALPSVDYIVAALLSHYDDHTMMDEEALSENTDKELMIELPGSPRAAVELLSQTRTILLENGHVDIAVNSSDADCSIWVTEHKTLLITTIQKQIHQKMKRLLDQHLEQFEYLKTPANHLSHFHYRPSKSLTYHELVDTLLASGWEEV
ncbi:MAG: hypothetical protein AAFS10_06340 [Myxococcota bacterium]